MSNKRNEHDGFDRTFVGSPLVMIIIVIGIIVITSIVNYFK